MGWKCSFLLVGDIDSGYFATKPKHDPARAREILQSMDMKVLGPNEVGGFDIYPESGLLTIGAYEKGAFIAHEYICGAGEEEIDKFFTDVLTAFEKKDLVAFNLMSVSGAVGLTYIKDGKLIRAFCASADEGPIVDIGEPLPAEKPLHENSYLEDGIRYFPRDIHGHHILDTLAGIGEDIVFAVAKQALGMDFEALDENAIETETLDVESQYSIFLTPID